jgi:hypothetical protein
MNTYVIHATVLKYDEGLEAQTKANVNGTFEAESEDAAESKAIEKFIEDYTHPKISNVRVSSILVIEILNGASVDEVNMELYRILKDGECHLRREDGQIKAYAIIYPWDIIEFTKIVGDHYFDEGGIDCRLLIGGDIWLRVDPIITESEGHLLSSYKACFPEEWDEYKDEILKEERNGNL